MISDKTPDLPKDSDSGLESELPASLLRADLVPERALTDGDKDEFQVSAIAGRVADLSLHGETPLDIALFGPWGSGKSSVFELLRREFNERGAKAVLIHYDAWKFGGDSLRKNFISHVANGLGFEEAESRADESNREFHTGLYESRRRALIDFDSMWGTFWRASLLLTGLYFVFLMVFALLSGGSSVLYAADFQGQVTNDLPRLLAPAGVAALVVAAVQLIVGGAKVDVDQAMPAADEEFSRMFRQLISKAREEKGLERLVFFVDELDRCSPEDVIKTLTAIKTFLGEDGCVFIVAADRAVLENALDALQQATPANEAHPYYSSAGSFFDKIFQHRASLPPFRPQRLTRFARDMVEDGGGLWGELKRKPVSEPNLDSVIYVLIPSHVTSPRRVKALLNDFALNVRIAQSRGVDWQLRANEIAKLTVIQTEFPALAVDLFTEPRLLAMILDPPLDPTPQLSRLLRRHGQRTEAAERDLEVGTEDLDRLIVKGDSATSDALRETAGRLLIRYLERTANYEDPGRDLLYLEAAGAAVDLNDPEVGRLVEEVAPESPLRAVEELVDLEVSRQLGACRVLAEMVAVEFGPERENVVTALLGVVESLGDSVAPIADSLCAALRGYMTAAELQEEQLGGALAMALSAESPQGDGLLDLVFEDDRLFNLDEQIEAAYRNMARMRQDQKASVVAAVAGTIAAGSDLFIDGLIDLADSDAQLLLTDDQVRGAIIQRFESTEDQEQLAERLSESVTRSPRSRRVLEYLLLSHRIQYPVVRRHADGALEDADPKLVDLHALMALSQCDVDDWGFWSKRISRPTYETSGRRERAFAALRQILGEFRVVTPSVQSSAEAVLVALGPFLEPLSEDDEPQFQSILQTGLHQFTWWEDQSAVNRQERLHSALRVMAHEAPSSIEIVETVCFRDAQRAPLAPAQLSPHTLAGLRALGQPLDAGARSELLESFPDGSALATDLRVQLALTRFQLRGVKELLPFAEVLEATKLPSDRYAHELIGTWLARRQSVENVFELIRVLGRTPHRANRTSFGTSCRSVQGRDRVTQLIVRVIESTNDGFAVWLKCIPSGSFHEAEVTKTASSEIRQARNADQRRPIVNLIVSLGLVEPKAQKQWASEIVRLLDSGTDVDFQLAQKATRALTPGHLSGARLTDAFKRAADKHSHYVSRPTAEHLSAIGVRLPKRSLASSATGFVRRAVGGN